MDDATLMTEWAHGWAVSRGTSAPARFAGGWFIPTGTAKETGRYLLTELADAHTVLRGEHPPRTWLKTTAGLPLTRGWQAREPGHLIDLDLAAGGGGAGSPADAAGRGGAGGAGGRGGAGDSLLAGATVEVEGGSIQVRVEGGNARARAGITGETAVVDQVETEPAHRRRGLGRAAMTVLTRELVNRGVARAVLVATPQGVPLYTALGWTHASLIHTAEYTAAEGAEDHAHDRGDRG